MKHYFLQEIGNHSRDAADTSPIKTGDSQRAKIYALGEFDASFFRVRFDRLIPAEKHDMRAMAELGPSAKSYDDAKDSGRDFRMPNRLSHPFFGESSQPRSRAISKSNPESSWRLEGRASKGAPAAAPQSARNPQFTFKDRRRHLPNRA
jgi:hypothetical protein